MTLASHPVWPFEPNWDSSVSETLAWMTDVMMSPTGAEQRRSLRYLPQRTFKFAVAVDGEERSVFDNMLMAYTASDWYLPEWHHVLFTTGQSTTTVIPCGQPPVVGTAILIKPTNEVTEVIGVTTNSFTVSPPLSAPLSVGAIFHPMVVARLVEPPALTAMSDGVEVAELQFLVVSPGVAPNASSGLSDMYRGFNVLIFEPDWTDSMDRGQQRLYATFEPTGATPLRADTANRPFPTQRHKWVLDGLGDHAAFYALMQALRGRAVPVWMPTWMYDMQLSGPNSQGDTAIVVNKCGFTAAGGPRPERQDLMIEMVNGTRIYRRVTASVNHSGGREILTLDAPLPVALNERDVIRICFMSLMRLDHDSIDVEHLTDMEGVSEVQLTFRAAPNLRVADPAF